MQHSPTRSSGVVDRKGGVDTDDRKHLGTQGRWTTPRPRSGRRRLGGAGRINGGVAAGVRTHPAGGGREGLLEEDPARLLADKMTIILVIAATVSAVGISRVGNAGGDSAVITFNTVLNYVQESRAESSLQALRDMSVAHSRVPARRPRTSRYPVPNWSR